MARPFSIDMPTPQLKAGRAGAVSLAINVVTDTEDEHIQFRVQGE
jgi:hypothetical protein